MSHSTRVDAGRSQYKELVSRQHDLQQNKDKAEGMLISILLLTQITELKMLIDIGRPGHRLYDVVLALLVASVGALIIVGLIVLYVGNLRYYRRARRRGSACRQRLRACWSCCRTRSPLRRRSPSSTIVRAVGGGGGGGRLTESYVCVPLGVSAAATSRSIDNVGGKSEAGTEYGGVDGGESTAGCCRCWNTYSDTTNIDPAGASFQAAEFGASVDVLDAEIDEARARLSAASARLAQATVDDYRGMQSDNRAVDVQAARRDKEAAEAELLSVESRRQRAAANQLVREDAEEKAVFRAIMFWQHFTMYVLYFVCLMNIFITAFGIYGGQPITIQQPTTQQP